MSIPIYYVGVVLLGIGTFLLMVRAEKRDPWGAMSGLAFLAGLVLLLAWTIVCSWIPGAFG